VGVLALFSVVTWCFMGHCGLCWNIIAIDPSIMSGKMKLMGFLPIPESTIAAIIPPTATSMIAGMSRRMNGCLSFGSVGGG
ncbi:MAG TPA: hypothetical protein K8V92_08525, partial [Corynebacterium falsenii]